MSQSDNPTPRPRSGNAGERLTGAAGLPGANAHRSSMGRFKITLTDDGTELKARSKTGNKQWVAVLEGTHPQYNYDREFVAYQKTETTERASGNVEVSSGDIVEHVEYSHSGKTRRETYYQVRDGELVEIDESDVEDALSDDAQAGAAQDTAA